MKFRLVVPGRLVFPLFQWLAMLVWIVSSCSNIPCPQGESLCDGKCLRSSNDRNNCGACGNVCLTGQYCLLAQCLPCENECMLGEIRCVASENQFQVCGDFNGDTCLTWGAPQVCGTGENCGCTTGCLHECEQGEKKCVESPDANAAIQTCANHDEDQCLEWGGQVECLEGQICQAGVCSCAEKIDSDGDGTLDCEDGCKDDANKTYPGTCGCGLLDVDTDLDGTPDCNDPDDDGDGFIDIEENSCGSDPMDSNSVPADVDDDSVCDNLDICNGDDSTFDTDGDGDCNDIDPDDDNDTWTDTDEIACGTNPLEVDSKPSDEDGDGICDLLDTCLGDDVFGDTDDDGECNDIDTDDDNDGWSDSDENECGTDSLLADSFPDDSDSDGLCDPLDMCVGNNDSGDTDGDGLCDDRDNIANMSSSLVAPVVDCYDIANYTAPTGSDKWWFEGDPMASTTAAKGQTFTTGNETVQLKAITYQIGSTKAEPIKDYLIRVGTITVEGEATIFTEIYSETASQNFTWSLDEYMTWTLGTYVALSANTTYAIDIAFTASTTPWTSGIPYIYYSGDEYPAGSRYHSGTQGVGDNNMNGLSGDRIFHLDLHHGSCLP